MSSAPKRKKEKMSDENKNVFDSKKFIEFATSLSKPIDFSQFSKMNPTTISWTKQPQHAVQNVYLYIELIGEDAVYSKYHFSLSFHIPDYHCPKLLDGQTPQECVDKLNTKIFECAAREKAKKDIWEKFGF